MGDEGRHDPFILDLSNKTLRIVLDSMPICVAIVGANRSYIFGNKFFCDLYAVSQADIVGMSTRLIFCSDADWDAVGRAAYPIIIGGGTYDCEHFLRRRDGSAYPARAIGRLLDADNPSLGTIWMVDDLTDHKIAPYVAELRRTTDELAMANAALAAEIVERRSAEIRLKESERQVRSILEAAPFPMLSISFPDGRFLFANHAAAELLNIQADRLDDLRDTDFYVNLQARRDFLVRLEEVGCVLGAEFQLRRSGDQRLWVMLSAVRFAYQGEDAVLVCLNDISARKRLEETLLAAGLRSEAALEAERQAAREQRNFLAMVSHEFRVPLAIIEAASQLLGIYTQSDDEAEDEVAKIRRATRRMSDLIDVCLAEDRLDSTMAALRIAQVDLRRVLLELCEEKLPVAGGRAMSVKAGGPIWIAADGTLLRVAFSNLIDNAMKFSPDGSPIDVDVTVDDDTVMISVADRGAGIAPEEQGRIFEKFYRSTRVDGVRGAGLGLYIVKRIVDLHGGSIGVDSLLGAGTSFLVWLPVEVNFVDNDRYVS